MMLSANIDRSGQSIYHGLRAEVIDQGSLERRRDGARYSRVDTTFHSSVHL